MRGALIHGVLLAVMLVYGYRTWTRDKAATPIIGSVALWDKTDADLTSIELKTEKKTMRLEHRTENGESYWWGVQTTFDKKPKAKTDDSGSGSGSGAGSGAGSSSGSGSGSAAGSGSGSVADEETKDVREFPLGDAADKVIKGFTTARAIREVGTPNDAKKKEYGFTDSKQVLTITFRDGSRSFLIGGGTDKYVLDQQSNVAYVLSRELVAPLVTGETALHLQDARGFPVADIEGVTITANGKSKSIGRIETDVEGKKVKTWGDVATTKTDQTAANFIDNANALKPGEFHATLKPADMTLVFTLAYEGASHKKLGTLSLYRHDKPGELAPDATLDPANPPKPETEYFIITEKTRVPALVRTDSAQRAENDVAEVFGDKPPNDLPAAPAKLPPGHGPGVPSGPGGMPAGNPHAGMPGAPSLTPPAPGPTAPGPSTPAPSTPAPSPHAAMPAPAPAPATPAPAHP